MGKKPHIKGKYIMIMCTKINIFHWIIGGEKLW